MDYIYIHIIFSIVNLSIAIFGMISVDRPLGGTDFWTTMVLLIFGPLGTLGLVVSGIITYINSQKKSTLR